MTKNFYERLEKIIHEAEMERRQISRKLLSYLAFFAFISILIIPIAIKHSALAGIPLGLLIFAVAYTTVEHTSDWKELFKYKVLHMIIREYFPYADYKPYWYLPLDVFNNSMLFVDRPKADRYRGEDYVEARYEGVKIEMSEVHAEYKRQYIDARGRRRTQWQTIFKGLLLVSEFPKRTKGVVLVYPSLGMEFFGNILKPRGFQKANMESPEFEKYFDVYTTDQIEARYVLSISLMERMVQFRKKTNSNLRFSFIGNTLYCAVEYKKDFLKTPSLFRSLYPLIYEEGFRQYVEEMELLLSIVKELKLNEKLWTQT